jgi:hypothetical protein
VENLDHLERDVLEAGCVEETGAATQEDRGPANLCAFCSGSAKAANTRAGDAS